MLTLLNNGKETSAAQSLPADSQVRTTDLMGIDYRHHSLAVAAVTGHLADTPTRGLDNSRCPRVVQLPLQHSAV